VVPDTQQPRTPLRADARRNRERIVAAALALFAERGADVPMEEIARAAGVGVGTLYRRFSDRDQLIRAVILDNFHRLVEAARRIEEEEPDPGQALGTLLYAALDLRLSVTVGMTVSRMFSSLNGVAEAERFRTEIGTTMGRILQRAQRAGSIRSDVEVGDIVVAVTALARSIPAHPMELHEMAVHRLIALILDGLRPSGGTPLPGRPITVQDLAEMRRASGIGSYPPAAND